MNTLDNLLLIIFVAFLLFYCYKKKKFIFSKLKKKETETAENAVSTPINNIVPMPTQNMGMFSQMYPYPCTIPTGTVPRTTYCKIIGVDNTVIDNDADLEHIINTELAKLTAAGFTIQNVNAFTFNITGTDTMHIAFCIVYGK